MTALMIASTMGHKPCARALIGCREVSHVSGICVCI